jgi:protein-tyrosine phosphatase
LAFIKKQELRGFFREKEESLISRRLLTRLGGLLEGGSEERLRSRSRLLTLPAYPRILVVCHGNLCRSPAAELFLKRRLSSRRFEISSGGLSHQENLPTPSDFVREARAFGLDLAGHRSRTVSPLLAEWADLILVMDHTNRNLLLDFGEDAVRKSAWLGAWDFGPLEIPDPFGSTSTVMTQILERLSRASDAMARELMARFPAEPGAD